MKTNKLFLRFIAVFGIVMILNIPGFGACSGGAPVVTWTTAITPYTSGAQAAKGTGSNSDNYIVNANQNGSLAITINNTDTTQDLTAYIYSGDQCSGAALTSQTINHGNSATLSANI